MTLRILRVLDLIVLALALPVFLIAGFPMLGYAVAAAAWLVQRGIAELVNRRAERSDDPRVSVGLLAGSMIGRGWLVAFSIFGVGLADEDAGLAAAVLFLSIFTIRFTAQAIVRPFDLAARDEGRPPRRPSRPVRDQTIGSRPRSAP